MRGDVSLQEEPVIFYSEEMTKAKMVVLKQKGIKLNFGNQAKEFKIYPAENFKFYYRSALL